MPALIVVAVLGMAAGRRWNTALRAVAPWLLGVNGVLLLAMAARLLAGR
jgi:hypothetical protein